MSPPRQAAALALAGYSVVLAVVLLSPSSAPGTATVDVVARLLAGLGAPASLADPDLVEVALNVAIFVPWSALAVVVWPRVSWQDATAYGFVATALVESFQGLALGDGRSASFSDVVANTLGALIGALAIRLALGTRGARPHDRS